jgi:hypothetical protein
MSISELEIKWLNFVRRLRVVGVLLIFVIIPFLGFVMIPIYFILAMVAVGDVSKLNRELNDQFLQDFRSKYVAASICKLIGSFVVHAGALITAFRMFIYGTYSTMYFPFYPYYIPPTIIVFVVGFIFMIIGSAVEIGAWNNLKLFVYHRKEIFPISINTDTINKIENLRSGAVAWALGFLGVTIIIGWINQIVGYIGLSNVAERLTMGEPIKPQTQVYQAPPQPTPPTPPTPPSAPLPPFPSAQEPQSVTDIEFCPMCGAKVSKGAMFCGECGVKLVN